ncbi:Werner syndrome ATP-dependent helicase-like [Centruroides sculpturatus]|uniref:Werner syndrome ATP-dependent helicase-like n=1 Tax=Centruroides sculpturatus TaxID=218467 RepID=UPI000C6CD0BA|nr:Werner syndrome ATP-dependent helicase-like [Centruroides sculpturatus]
MSTSADTFILKTMLTDIRLKSQNALSLLKEECNYSMYDDIHKQLTVATNAIDNCIDLIQKNKEGEYLDEDCFEDGFSGNLLEANCKNLNKNMEEYSDVDLLKDDDDNYLLEFCEETEREFFNKSVDKLENDGCKEERILQTDSDEDKTDEDISDLLDLLDDVESEEHVEVGEDYTKALKQHFGYSHFRPLQWDIIKETYINRRDSCVVMATGSGKSLCYQFPAVHSKKTVVVISPLISLMEDQVLAMNVANIPACYLGSAQNEKKEVMSKLYKFTEMKISCTCYHAGISITERKLAHRKFVDDRVDVIVATVAFGMGIDKPDVRRVIHYGAPTDIESFYQEAGRAGRDGLRSICQIFYSQGDFGLSMFRLQEITNDKFCDHKLNMIEKMKEVILTGNCRRQLILSYFDKKWNTTNKSKPFKNCCDNCTKRLKREENGCLEETKIDYGKEAKLIFEMIKDLGNCGYRKAILALIGSNSKTLPNWMKSHQNYGKGKHKSENWWKDFYQALIMDSYINQHANRIPGKKVVYYTLTLSQKAESWLKNCSNSTPSLLIEPFSKLLKVRPRSEVVKTLEKTESRIARKTELPILSTYTTEKNEENVVPLDPREEELKGTLYKNLMQLRNEIANEEKIAPYMVFSNKNLLDCVLHRPTSLQNLARLEDVADSRVKKFGGRIVDFVSDFCSKNQLEGDVFPEDTKSVVNYSSMDDRHLDKLEQLSQTEATSYTMFEIEGKDLMEIKLARSLAPSTIMNHLQKAIKVGLPLNMQRLGITTEMRELIEKVVFSSPINGNISRITPIKDLLPEHVGFDHIKLVLAFLECKYGIKEGIVNLPPEESVGQSEPSEETPESLPKNEGKRKHPQSPVSFSRVGRHKKNNTLFNL